MKDYATVNLDRGFVYGLRDSETNLLFLGRVFGTDPLKPYGNIFVQSSFYAPVEERGWVAKAHIELAVGQGVGAPLTLWTDSSVQGSERKLSSLLVQSRRDFHYAPLLKLALENPELYRGSTVGSAGFISEDQIQDLPERIRSLFSR